jgi:hypothetical protein
MAKLIQNDIVSLTNEQSALAALNSNYAVLEAFSDTVLSRDGTTPNQMGADLDMNSNRILNLPQPTTVNEPLRLQDLQDFLGTGTIEIFLDKFNVLAYGATGNGLTDDTNAILAAVAAVNANGGGTLFFPAGTYKISSPIVFRSFTRIQGEGPKISKILVANNANCDVLISLNADLLIGTGSSGGVNYCVIQDISIDGNKANNSSGRGITIYGRRFWLSNVLVEYMAEDGVYTEWSSTAPAFDNDPTDAFMESFIDGLNVQYCAGHGLYFNGPHDSLLSRCIIAINNHNHVGTNAGVRIGPNAGGTFLNTVHSWGDDQHYAFQIEADTTTCLNCYADGAYDTLVRVMANRFNWQGGRAFSGFLFTGTATGGSNTTIGLGAAAGGTYNLYTPYTATYVVILAGTGSGQGRLITNYNSGTFTATVAAWGVNPDATSVYGIVPVYRTVLKGFDLGPTFSVFNQIIKTRVDDAPGAALAMTNFGGFSSSIHIVGECSQAIQLTGVARHGYTGSIPVDVADFFINIDSGQNSVRGWRVSQDLEPQIANTYTIGSTALPWSKTFTQTLELGHATDTTLARSGAGVVTIEGATVAKLTNTLGDFASTTSAQLAGVISNETGSGSLVFGTAPTFTNGYNVSGSPSDGVQTRYSADAFAPSIWMEKSRNATPGAHTVVQNNDGLGNLLFQGSDGSTMRQAAQIRCEVDGTPGSNDMPGRLVFATSPDGSSNPAEAMRIDNAQQVLFNVDRALRFNNATSGAGASTGTLTNSPAAGNPTHWLKINIGGTNFTIPCWPG